LFGRPAAIGWRTLNDGRGVSAAARAGRWPCRLSRASLRSGWGRGCRSGRRRATTASTTAAPPAAGAGLENRSNRPRARCKAIEPIPVGLELRQRPLGWSQRHACGREPRAGDPDEISSINTLIGLLLFHLVPRGQ
jgi:hypothetical protein